VSGPGPLNGDPAGAAAASGPAAPDGTAGRDAAAGPLLEVRHVSKSLGGKPILDDVSATAERVSVAPEEIGEPCPDCGKPLVIKRGRFGEFIACSGYPECKYTRKIVKTTGLVCPKCGQGELIQRKAGKGKAKGRYFYGCSRYPDCDFASWKKPTPPKKGKAPDEVEEETAHGLE
jgi:ssDNA-binding Zn-finger/Zn-ribbon topoisomerase 1